MDKWVISSPKRKAEEQLTPPKSKKLKENEDAGSLTLQELLKVDGKTLPETGSFDEIFEQIAQKILNETELVANGKRHRINEIEFYLTGDAHPDPFTHQHKQQLSSCDWYFHKKGNSFRTGNYKGLDVTLGSNCYGGILFRTIEEIGTKKIHDGPCITVNRLLSCIKEGLELDDLIKLETWDWHSFNEKSCLYLTESKEKLNRKIISCPRVGLTLKKAGALRPPYICKDYRYLSTPKETKKGKVNMALGLHAQGKSLDMINQITGAPIVPLRKWITQFQEGEKLESTDKFKGVDLEPNVLSELMGACFTLYVKPKLKLQIKEKKKEAPLSPFKGQVSPTKEKFVVIDDSDEETISM